MSIRVRTYEMESNVKNTLRASQYARELHGSVKPGIMRRRVKYRNCASQTRHDYAVATKCYNGS